MTGRGRSTAWPMTTRGGKFGPFAGQFFLAELMFGGADHPGTAWRR